MLIENNGSNEQKPLCYAGKYKAAPPVLYVCSADVCFYKVTPVDWSIVTSVIQSQSSSMFRVLMFLH